MNPEFIQVALEVGRSRTIAVALRWPGWCRSGRDESSALQTFINYGPRYVRVLENSPLMFQAPSSISNLSVMVRLAGNATTDFGAPAVALATDSQPVETAEFLHWQIILEAGWSAFDQAVKAAGGKTLRKGPRGGGRDLDRLVEHVKEGELAYLSSLGGKTSPCAGCDPSQALLSHRQAIRTSLGQSVRGELPAYGPRGGLRWTPRYFIRRFLWHVLDHAWEIEDRIE